MSGKDGQLSDAALKMSSLDCFLEGAFNLLMVFPFVFLALSPFSACACVCACAYVLSAERVCLCLSRSQPDFFFSAGVNYGDFLYFDGDMLIYTTRRLGSKYVLSGMGSR